MIPEDQQKYNHTMMKYGATFYEHKKGSCQLPAQVCVLGTRYTSLKLSMKSKIMLHTVVICPSQETV